MQLPIFPSTTQFLSATWGVNEYNDFVYYLHNGSPVHCHHKDDINSYRYITGTLVNNKHCTPSALSKVFGVNVKKFQNYAKRLRKEGASSFFSPTDERGKCHKMTPDKIKEAQSHLDNGISQQQTGKLIKVSESAIRYHLRKGTLKKK